MPRARLLVRREQVDGASKKKHNAVRETYTPPRSSGASRSTAPPTTSSASSSGKRFVMRPMPLAEDLKRKDNGRDLPQRWTRGRRFGGGAAHDGLGRVWEESRRSLGKDQRTTVSESRSPDRSCSRIDSTASGTRPSSSSSPPSAPAAASPAAAAAAPFPPGGAAPASAPASAPSSPPRLRRRERAPACHSSRPVETAFTTRAQDGGGEGGKGRVVRAPRV